MVKHFFCIIFPVLFLQSCSSSGRLYKFTRDDIAMGTSLSVTFFSLNKNNADQILENVFNYANELENLYSVTREHSLLYKLNKNKKLEIKDTKVLELIKKSLMYARLSDGAFDPLLYNLSKLWNISEFKNVPDKYEIEKVLKSCGYKNLNLDGNVVVLDSDSSIDLGAIAKGSILKQIALYLDTQNIKNYIINGGGDIVIKGLYNGKRKWNIAITNPYLSNEYYGTISLTDCSIVTSGNYERFVIAEDEKRYHHILDGKTGYPAESGIDSVTVISSDPEEADAMATALFVMGKDRAISFADKITTLEAIIIGDRGKFLDYTSGISIESDSNVLDYYSNIRFLYKNR